MKQQFNIDEALELIKQGAKIDGTFLVPKSLKFYGTLHFLLFEHFVEHGKLI